MTFCNSVFLVGVNKIPQEIDIHRVFDQAPLKKHVAELLRLQVQKSISYSQEEWVPDQYEVLMREGLIKFRYSPYDWAKTVWRIFSLTEAGEKWAEGLRSRSMRVASVPA